MSVQGASVADFSLDYGHEVEKEIERLETLVKQAPGLNGLYPPRWLALKLLEQDQDIVQRLAMSEAGQALVVEAGEGVTRLTERFGEDVDTVIADKRYGWINGVVRKVVQRPKDQDLSVSDKIDQVVTSRLLGLPIFLFAMWATLKITADVSAPYLDWVDGLIGGPITRWALALLAALGLDGTWLESLVVDGVIAGVGGVLVFVPVLMSLYLVLAVLEDSGYMARAAFVMDRLMNALGLHGKSFLPMLVGFGCTVPAFYATRTLENRKDRILTALLVPFMSCGARLPVYLLFAAVFFPRNSGTIVFAMYLLGILTAVVVGMVLKNTVFKTKQASTFVMELPPYRLPTLKGIAFHVWEHTSGFLRKATGIILLVSVLLWFMMAVPLGGGEFADTDIGESLFARVSGVTAPILKPLGFGGWESSGALITGFVAKEVVVSTMAQIYDVAEGEEAATPTTLGEDVVEIGSSFVNATVDTVKSLPLIVGINLFEAEEDVEQTDLMAAIQSGFDEISGGHGGLAALAFMVFVLIYTPCMVAVAAERQEFGSRVMWASIIGQSVLAWLMAFAVFQGGLLLGLG